MRRLDLIGFLTALLAGVAIASVGFAQPPFGGPRPGGGPDRFTAEHAAQLGLDDPTREAIDQIVDESRMRAREIRGELRGLHQEMHELLSQKTPDEAAVMLQAEAIGQAETELHKHRLETLIRIRALLTDEQRAELIEIRGETRAQWLQPLIDSCQTDVDQFCPEAEDRWSQRRCLRQRWEEISPECQGAIDAAKGEDRRGRRQPGRRSAGEF
jgi:Spy/CpxP family protein refolding chaperone